MHSKKHIAKVFTDHDINDEGYLSSEYLHKALISLNIPVELSDMTDVLESVGREKEGTVEINDFTDIVTEFMGSDTVDEYAEEEEDEEEYNASSEIAFQMLADPSLNGITLESLLKVCNSQQESWTEQQIIEMMNDADLNHDGIIDPNEFRIVCRKAGL